MYIQDWVNEKLQDVATKLPTLVHSEPASFACGYNTGYKQAILDLDKLIADGAVIYKSVCRCGDKYHRPGFICL